MTINTMIISKRLPSLNELISALSGNKYAGGNFKRRVEREIASEYTATCDHFEVGWYVFRWHEYNMKRDPDNIGSAVKFIFDALQTMNFIPRDNWQYVRDFAHQFVADADQLEDCYVEVIHCETEEEYFGIVTRQINNI